MPSQENSGKNQITSFLGLPACFYLKLFLVNDIFLTMVRKKYFPGENSLSVKKNTKGDTYKKAA